MPRDRSEWLVDEAGNLWPIGAPGLRVKVGSDLPWEFLTRYAVVNLGYCSVSSLPHGARIRFRAQIIAQPALAAAIHWLAEQKASRAVVSILLDAWTHEIFWSKWSAIGHLSAQADAQLVTRRSDFSARRAGGSMICTAFHRWPTWCGMRARGETSTALKRSPDLSKGHCSAGRSF
jgi:hypothetical protein